MPTEIRHIVFRSEELFRALQLYRSRAGRPMPADRAVRLEVLRDPDIRVEIELDRDAGRVAAAGDEIAAALILYCVESGVPLPKEARKFLQLFGSSVGLVITKEMAGRSTAPTPAR